MKLVQRMLGLCLAGCLLLAGCARGGDVTDTPEPGSSRTTDGSTPQPAPSGVGIGLTLTPEDVARLGTKTEAALALVSEMRVETVQLSFLISDLIGQDGTVPAWAKQVCQPLLSALRASGVQKILLTVRGGYWENGGDDRFAFPYPDSDTGKTAEYLQYLRNYGAQLVALARAYPEVTHWQTGGGYDAGDDMAHPVGSSGKFYPAERAAINADLAAAAKQAFAASGVTAKVVLGAFTLGAETAGAENFLRETCRYLASGESPLGVTRPGDCFDALSWKPAVSWYALDADAFAAGTGRLLSVGRDAGCTAPVYLTGVTFPDFGSRSCDERQAAWLGDLVQALSGIAELSCTVTFGSLLEETERAHSGLFRCWADGSFAAKEKAKALCRLCGGDADRLDRYKGDHVIYDNRTDGQNERNGIGFAIKGADERGLDIARIMDLLEDMNVKSMRNWMNISTLLTSPTTVNSTEVEKQKMWLAMLEARGVTKIVGMSQGAFWKGGNGDALAVPYRDLTDGSEYRAFLEQYRQSWKTLAGTFPEVRYWEVGNETNNDPFLHPVDYTTRGTKFTADEKAMITVDMMYYAARGVKEANPAATVIFPAMAPTNGFASMRSFLGKCYAYIESGDAPGGTDPDAYFDGMAWHMYYFRTSFTADNWLEGNNSIHDVMVAHGDAEKKVFLTEFGFSDGGSAEKDEAGAQAFREIFRLADQMHYLDSLYPFRMIEDETAAEWGGTIEIYYGMFRVFDKTHFGAKAKARAICEIYGGDLSRLDRYIGKNSVYPR